MNTTLDLLLRPDVPDVQKHLPTEQVKIKRLSKVTGEAVVFCIHGLTARTVRKIRESEDKDTAVRIVLAGVSDPSFKDSQLIAKFGGLDAAEAVKAILLPGEIEDLSRAIEQLSGYRGSTIETVKKN